MNIKLFRKIGFFLTLTTAFSALPSLAQESKTAPNENLKVEEDELFPEIKSEETELTIQSIEGLSQAVLSGLLFRSAGKQGLDPALTEVSRLVQEAEVSLENAQNLLTASDKAKSIAALENTLEKLSKIASDADNDVANAIDEIARKIAETSEKSVVDDAVKASQIESAQARLANATAKELELAVKTGKLGLVGKSIKGIKVLGGSIMIIDVGTRVYVWNILNKNPTHSPVSTFLFKKAYPGLKSLVSGQ